MHSTWVGAVVGAVVGPGLSWGIEYLALQFRGLTVWATAPIYPQSPNVQVGLWSHRHLACTHRQENQG